jgi:hypothetical protein
MSEDPSNKPLLITTNTFVPIASIGAAIMLTVLVMSKLNTIENSINELRKTTSSMADESWTKANMESWIDKTKVRNPQLVLPGVAEIKPSVHP